MASITLSPAAIFTDDCGKLVIAAEVEFAPGFCLTAGDRFLRFETVDPYDLLEAPLLNLDDYSFYQNTGVVDEVTDDFPLVSIDGLMRRAEDLDALTRKAREHQHDQRVMRNLIRLNILTALGVIASFWVRILEL